MTDINPPEHAIANAAETLLGAPRGLRHIQGGQFGPVFHGTGYNWKGSPSASYDSPFHVDTDASDFPAEKAWLGGGDARDDWESLTQGRVKEFRFKPEARIHITETGHADGILPDAEHEAVKRGGYDATMFKHRGQAGLGIVYNADALEHVADRGHKEIMGESPEDVMDYQHGEDWRDWI